MENDAALGEAIAEIASRFQEKALARAAVMLSERYRAGVAPQDACGSRQVRSDDEAVAYLVTRFPATFAACKRATGLVGETLCAYRPVTLIDVGAGTGASALAAGVTWPSLRSVRLVEPSRHMAALGAELLRRLGAGDGWEWLARDGGDVGGVLGSAKGPDLVMMSYVLGELPPARAVALATAWWERGPDVLIVVEPGTPAGFGLVRRIRDELTRRGGRVAAPCPHERACPMPDAATGGPGRSASVSHLSASDWCHFAVRLARSVEHRRLKGGQLAYEDEKFSFVAVTRVPEQTSASRIVRRPVRGRGKVDLVLCAAEGLVRERVPRSAPAYRAATRAEWGDAWPVPES